MYGSPDNTNMIIVKLDGITTRRLVIVGDAAHGVARSGAPVPLGLTYRVSTPAKVDDGDTEEWRGDGYGRAYILDGALQEFTAIASAAYTETQIADLVNPGAKGALICLDVTAHSGSPSITPSILWKVPGLSSAYETLFTAAAVTTSPVRHTYLVYPGDLALPGSGTDLTQLEKLALPLNWAIEVTHANSDSITYSVQGAYLL
jgi:hypothetical protein